MSITFGFDEAAGSFNVGPGIPASGGKENPAPVPPTPGPGNRGTGHPPNKNGRGNQPVPFTQAVPEGTRRDAAASGRPETD